MDADTKELAKALNNFAKVCSDSNKIKEREVKMLSDLNENYKELRVKYTTLATSIDKLTETIQNNLNNQ